LKLNLFAFKFDKLIMDSLHEVLARRFPSLGTGRHNAPRDITAYKKGLMLARQAQG